jgi:serine/threonine-protein kinase
LLSRLLDDALELPREARDTWLESLPGAHAALRDTLRTMLRAHAHAETRDFLNTVPKLDGTAAPGTRLDGPSLAPGTAIGPYIIEEEIGRGGMGAVWRARRADGVLKRSVALKLPHAGACGRELIDRFARERDILSALAHPHIARLYDAGFDAGGQPYLALEYVPGQTLTEYCDNRRLDVRSRLELFQQVLSAVQYALTHLVVHRDIKPSNVIVGDDGHAMLLDFGIAKLLAVDPPDDTGSTQLHAALTPDYASPEQVRREPVTPASDIYSLGVLLFELLAGARPYRLARGTRAELEEAVLRADVPRPSRSIRSEAAAAARATTAKGLSRALRGDLDTIILKAMRKEPMERYATASAFLQDIERYLRGQPVLARPARNGYRLRKFVARHLLPVAAGSVALVIVMGSVAVALYEAQVAASERERALELSLRNEALIDDLRRQAIRSLEPAAGQNPSEKPR